LNKEKSALNERLEIMRSEAKSGKNVVIKEVEKIVIKEVIVEKPVEIIKEIYIEVPVEAGSEEGFGGYQNEPVHRPDTTQELNQRDENFDGSMPTSEILESYSPEVRHQKEMSQTLDGRKSSIKKNQKTIHKYLQNYNV
jgi:Ca2+-binding EF-hand superfamily protein